ncbi:hypothetical protein ACFQ3K_14810 [Brucella gallinifaecis]|uniref:Phage portal protein n=1 Tax=Brucella gallinifaecis TaxID=215590 RepID=A0A502BSV1_9HYPH|nr:hypothetical protein [Brucella gallinifaecis]TPF76731.1 hypothetical protein FHY56_04365 [Brucella gallinifaecis]
MTFNGKAFGQEIVKEVKSFVTKELAPLFKRLDDLEKRIDSLPVPKDGKDADMNEVRSIISDELKSITEAVNAIQPAPELPDIPKLIEIEFDARGGDEEIRRIVDEACRATIAEIPLPQNGKDGENGMDGASVSLDDVLPVLQKQVDEHLAGIPAPQDGKSVTIEDVAPLIRSEVEKRVSELPKPKDGKDGRDGLDVKDLFRGEGGVLIATMSDGRVKELGQFVGKDGENGLPGKDGSDGVGFDDLSVDYDGEKTVILRFTKGENVKEFPLVLPVVIDRGVFSEGKTYSPGDGVTWGGSFWIAQEETGEKPDTAKGWRLAVKKGRDGKDAKSAPAVNSGPIRVTIPKAGE